MESNAMGCIFAGSRSPCRIFHFRPEWAAESIKDQREDTMLTERAELGAWLRLLQTPGIGLETTRKLLAALGPPQAIWTQTQTAWQQVAGVRVAQAMGREPEDGPSLADATWDWLQSSPDDRAIVTLGDEDYPAALLQIADPPCLLYATGRIHLLRHLQPAHALAVVGSRNPTPQGRLNARAFAQSLAQSGLTIVSGLALGVDGAAHEGALDTAATGQLATIAVVGTGLDRVYPKQHLTLARQIAERGLILSEYPLGTPPLAENFPRRNRIISGLAQGTLVVEAALESGSLITAKQALEQGREVFAIPGSIHSPQSKGCHALIRQGAKLVESAQDVLEELRLPDPFAQVPLALDTPPPDKGLLALLGHDPVGLDALQARSGLDTAQLQAELLDLELEGQVKRLPGGLFQRLVRG
jgi:DNA processing protein